MVEGIAFERKKLRHSLYTLGFGDRTRQHDDGGSRCDGVRPLHIEGSLKSPADLRGIGWIKGHGAKRSQYFERRRIRQTVTRVERLQVRQNGGAPV